MERKQRNSYKGPAAAFLFVGAILLVYSLLFNLQIAVFAGLGLLFWGAIFAFAKRGRYVACNLLDLSAKSTYSTTDRIIDNFKLNGQAYYLPAYPKDVNVPLYFAKLREPTVFISEIQGGKPSYEELATGKFLCEKSPGVFVTAPGSGILSQMEKDLRLDFSKMEITELASFLPRYLTEQLGLARNVHLSIQGANISMRAVGIVYENLYRSDPPIKSLYVLGCPVISAVATALAKASSKMVTVNRVEVLPLKTIGIAAFFSLVQE